MADFMRSGTGTGVGFGEGMVLWDPKIRSHFIRVFLAESVSRLYEDWVVFAFGWSLQVMSAPNPNGFVPSFMYILFSAVLFFATCLHRKSSKNLRLNRK